MTIMVASIWYTSFPIVISWSRVRRVLPVFLRDLPASLAEREEDSDDDESFHDAPRRFEFPAPFGFLPAFASGLRRMGKAVVVPFARWDR